jgi:hypothetical protein
MDGIIIPPDAERVARGTGTFRVLAELDDLEVIDMRFGPDFAGVDPHAHEDHVDSFYILEGEAEFLIGEEVVRATSTCASSTCTRRTPDSPGASERTRRARAPGARAAAP